MADRATKEHWDEALAVRQGLKRLAAVKEEDRPFVAGILRHASGADLAQYALAKEGRAAKHRASNTAIYSKLYRARSA